MIVSLAQAAADQGLSTGVVVAIAGGTGVATSAIVSFFASAYGQHREDQRVRESWLRDRRLEAYTAWHAAMAVLAETLNARARGEFIPLHVSDPRWSALNVATGQVEVLGPPAVTAEVFRLHGLTLEIWDAHRVLPEEHTARIDELVRQVFEF